MLTRFKSLKYYSTDNKQIYVHKMIICIYCKLSSPRAPDRTIPSSASVSELRDKERLEYVVRVIYHMFGQSFAVSSFSYLSSLSEIIVNLQMFWESGFYFFVNLKKV